MIARSLFLDILVWFQNNIGSRPLNIRVGSDGILVSFDATYVFKIVIPNMYFKMYRVFQNIQNIFSPSVVFIRPHKQPRATMASAVPSSLISTAKSSGRCTPSLISEERIIDGGVFESTLLSCLDGGEPLDFLKGRCAPAAE